MKGTVKNLLNPFPPLYFGAASAYYALRGRDGRDKLVYWARKACSNAACDVVVIGANDGKSAGPFQVLFRLRKAWRILSVEPVPYLYERLKNFYPSEERFRFENLAINDGSEMEFFWVDQRARKELGDIPHWFDQLGSFDRDHIVKHLDGQLEPYIVSSPIQGVTLDHLLKRNSIRDLQLLIIDAEGYDWEILSQLDLESYKPTMIMFEQAHLDLERREEILAFFGSSYGVFSFGNDCLALRLNNDQLTESDFKFLSENHRFGD